MDGRSAARGRRARAVGLVLAVALVAIGCATDLGTLGGDSSEAFDVNEAGLVVGEAQLSSGAVHAFSHATGKAMVDLGTLPGDTASTAHGVNAGGVVVGASTGTSMVAVEWSASGAITTIGTLGGDAQAWAVNDAGVVVGESKDAAGTTGSAFVWQPGDAQPTALPALAGASDSVAYGISATGTIVGAATVGGVSHAVRWLTSTATPDDLGGALGPSVAYAVNRSGLIAGQASFDVGGTVVAHAAVWHGASAADDLTPTNTNTSVAHDLNDADVVAGTMGAAPGTLRPLLWNPATKAVSAVPALQGASDSVIVAINDDQLPVGHATKGGHHHAVVFDKGTVTVPPTPLAIGGTKNFLGTGGLISTTNGFTATAESNNREDRWLGISGRCASKEQGEEIMAVSDANWTGSGGSYAACTGGATVANTEFDPNGYFYEMDLDVDHTGPVYLEVFDAAICAGGTWTTESPTNYGGAAFPIHYAVRGADATPDTPLDNPTLATFDTDPVNSCAGGSAPLADRWRTMYVFDSPHAGRYFLQVTDPNDPGTLDRSLNLFSIRARVDGPTTTIGSQLAPTVWGLCSTVPSSVEPPYAPDCPQIRATTKAGLYVKAPMATRSFDLVDLPAEDGGRALNVSLWDLGEGAQSVALADPLGHLASFTWVVDCSGGATPPAGGCAGTAPTTALDVSGTGPQPGPNRISISKYNDRLVTLTVRLPADLAAAYGGATRWRVLYNSFGGSVTDRTTWSAFLTP